MGCFGAVAAVIGAFGGHPAATAEMGGYAVPAVRLCG